MFWWKRERESRQMKQDIHTCTLSRPWSCYGGSTSNRGHNRQYTYLWSFIEVPYNSEVRQVAAIFVSFDHHPYTSSNLPTIYISDQKGRTFYTSNVYLLRGEFIHTHNTIVLDRFDVSNISFDPPWRNKRGAPGRK